MLTESLIARAAGVVADYQRDERRVALRQMWPTLADSLDDLVEMWHRAHAHWLTEAPGGDICGDVRPWQGRLYVCDLPRDHADEVHQQSGGIVWRQDGSII